MTRHHAAPPSNTTATRPDVEGGWGRQRLTVVLAAVAAVALLLVTGLAYAVHFALTPTGEAAPTPGASTRVSQPGAMPAASGPGRDERRDRIAAAPMPVAAPADAEPTAPASELADPIAIPTATTAGPAMVPSGFPHTPQGAVGQLAAIESTVLQAMSIPVAHAVYAAWALPGGIGAGQWSMTGHVQSFLGAARMGARKDVRTVVMTTPAGARVKGTDGPDWVLACVLLEVRAVIESEARIGYGHCERMQWQDGQHDQRDQHDSGEVGRTGPVGGRWMIAPGDPPALAPSTWPSSAKAIAVGWKAWVDAEPTAEPNAGPGAAPLGQDEG